MKIIENFALDSFNTFGIKARTRYFANVTTTAEVVSVLENPATDTLPLLVLGGGSNILFTKDWHGLTLKISIDYIEKLHETDQHVWVKAGAGTLWHTLVSHCVENQWNGIENLALIYGTVGAAPMQNIGAYGVELKDVFESLEALELSSRTVKHFDRQACKFGYRESFFKHEGKNQFIILSVTLKLHKAPIFNTSYGAIRDTLKALDLNELSAKNISRAVIHIRTSKLPDPSVLGNAGSFFKNPEIEAQQFAQLQTLYPHLPSFPAPEGKVKVPAGWLIEQCGWKGKQVGQTGSHKDQALVLVNYGNATGAEVAALARQIQESVWGKFQVELHTEVNII